MPVNKPPAAYLEPCEQTEFKGETFGDALSFALVAVSERKKCATQIKLIKEFFENGD